MADTKVSELGTATSVAASDYLYLVQSQVSKKVTVETLFEDVSTPVKFTDTIAIGDNDTISSAVSIPLTSNITFITNPTASGAMSIGSGQEGQVKIIIMTANVSATTMVLSDSQLDVDITFTSAGDTATLLFHNTKWYMIGGTASVS